MDAERLRFVHISDTHIGPSRDFSLYGVRPFPCIMRIVEAINGLTPQPDFVIHTGDIVATPSTETYGLAAEVFSKVKAPLYFVTGNHDTASDIHRFLPSGPREDLQRTPDVLSYTFTMKGIRFLTLDARGPDSIDPHGVLSDEQLDHARRIASEPALPLAVFVHFPPLELDADWFDRDMLLLNGMLLHGALMPARGRLRGVFFGHVHRGMQIYSDGILYASVASTFCQLNAWPADPVATFDTRHPPSFNLVAMTSTHTVIKEYSVPRPQVVDFH